MSSVRNSCYSCEILRNRQPPHPLSEFWTMPPHEDMTNTEESVGLEPKYKETEHLKEEQQQAVVAATTTNTTTSMETNEKVDATEESSEVEQEQPETVMVNRAPVLVEEETTTTMENVDAMEESTEVEQQQEQPETVMVNCAPVLVEEETTTTMENVDTTETSSDTSDVVDPWAAYGSAETTTSTTNGGNGNSTSQEGEKEEEETTNNEPPPQLSFGSRFQAFKTRFAARRFQEEQVATSSTTTAEIPSQEVMTANANANYQVLRASTISVTVVKETLDSKWGFGIALEDENKVVIKKMTGDGLLEKAPFQMGDVLKTVNNQKCTNDEVTIQLLVKYEGGVPITLLVESPIGNPRVVQAMVRKPSPDSKIGIGFYNTESENQTLLQINHLAPNGLLAHSALSQGDLVLAINSTMCSQMKAEDAAALIANSDDDTITVVAMRPQYGESTRAQSFMRQAKRGAIALGGGTLVGVGLIFIPTLPPPFGEVLILGGVSLLGTEFEAPKRVMKSARDSLERAVGRGEDGESSSDAASDQEKQTKETTVDDDETETETNKEETTSTTPTPQEEVAAATGDAVEEQQQQQAPPPTRTMGQRFRNFGRIHVLPFMDQVVGDRNEQKEAASPQVETNAQDATPEETANEQPSTTSTTSTLEAAVLQEPHEEESP